MPSVSKQQQKLFGLVRALQKGDVDSSKVSKQVKDLAKKMKKSDVKAYASTKHDDLPKKVKREDLRKLVKKYGAKRVKESVFAVMGKTRKDGYREPEIRTRTAEATDSMCTEDPQAEGPHMQRDRRYP